MTGELNETGNHPSRPGRRHRTGPTGLFAVLLAASMVMTACLPATPTPPAPTPPATSSTVPSTFKFIGGGYGHGIGMSQYGAQGRGKAGQSATQILSHYYPGTSLSSMSTPGPSVLIGTNTTTTFRVTSGSLYVETPTRAKKLVGSAGDTIRIRRVGTQLLAKRTAPTVGNEFEVAKNSRLFITWSEGADIYSSDSKHSYRWGRIVIEPKPSSSDFDIVVDEMTMQEYLFGLAEMPLSWSAAALQAQAITGRTYAARRVAGPRTATYDMYATTADQHWIGVDNVTGSYGWNWIVAVSSSEDTVIKSGSKLAETYYSSSNGGYSEATSYVWYASIPYLVAKSDPYDSEASNKNHKWTESYTNKEIVDALKGSGYRNAGSVMSITVKGNVGASGRVDKATVTIKGTKATFTVTGNQLRSALNKAMPSSRDLLSTKFTISSVK